MKRIGYSNGNGDDRCIYCKSPTFLLSTSDFWSIDEEPIKNGQYIKEIKDDVLREKAEGICSDGIELGTEITCHYCPVCDKITSICVNW